MRSTVSRVMVGGLACWALAACGGTDDKKPPGPHIGGMYELTRHTLNSSDCDTEGMDLDGPPFFEIKLDRFFGQPYYALEGCESQDRSTCDWAELSGSFFESTGAAWLGEVLFSSGGQDGFPCTIGISESLAIPEEGGILIEMRSFSLDAPDLTGDACDPDAAEARRDQLVCERYEVAHGNLVE